MSKKPEFTEEGYQSNIRDIAGEQLPGPKTRRLSKKEQDQIGIPSPDAVLEAIRTKPIRGTPSRTQSALSTRKALRLSQRDFAKLIGTSPAAVRNWEQGRTRIPRMARKLMHVVERHPDVLADLAEVDSNH
jgi:DNA-binding XRE family transcriptional regulator